jgi:hypothetical protein
VNKYSNKTNRFSIEQVVTLDIDSNGCVTQRLTNLETTLENTLLNRLYPGIKVVIVNVPTEPLDAYEESQVENAMANLKFKNTPYKLVGASGSSKDGRFYFVDRDHSPAIAEQTSCMLLVVVNEAKHLTSLAVVGASASWICSGIGWGISVMYLGKPVTVLCGLDSVWAFPLISCTYVVSASK